MPAPVPGPVSKTSAVSQSVFTIPALVVPAGSNLGIFVGTGWSSPSAQQTVSVVRNAPTPETFPAKKWDVLRGLNHRNSGWLLLDPVAGSYDFTVTCTAAEDELWAWAALVSKLHPTDPYTGFTTGEGTSSVNPKVVMAPAPTPEELLLDNLYSFSTTITGPGGGQTLQAEEEGIGAFASGAGSSQPGSAGDRAGMDWHTPSANWILGVISLRGAPSDARRPLAVQQRFS